MALGHSTVIYDVNDFKVYPLLTDDNSASLTYGAGIDVPGIAEAALNPSFITAELRGDGGQILAKKGNIDKFTCAATYGRLSLDVLLAVLGGTITDVASTSSSWKLPGANALPYFKAAFKIDQVDTGFGDVVVTLYKCQLTGGTLIDGRTQQFGQPTMQIESVAPVFSGGSLIDVSLYSTVQTLPA